MPRRCPIPFAADNPAPRCEASGKVCFSKRAAQEKLNRARKDRHRKGRVDHVYQCDECSYWHLSSKGESWKRK